MCLELALLVCFPMVEERAVVRELRGTSLTLVRFFTCVENLMLLQIGFIREAHTTRLTRRHLQSRMFLHMVLQVVLSFER